MKIKVLFFFLIFFCYKLYSQDTIMVYFDENWEETKLKKAEYMRVNIIYKNKFAIQDFTTNGKAILKELDRQREIKHLSMIYGEE